LRNGQQADRANSEDKGKGLSVVQSGKRIADAQLQHNGFALGNANFLRRAVYKLLEV